MQKLDIAELRRLHAQGARSSHSFYVFDCIPALLDALEALREMTVFAETYGELVQLAPKVAGAVVGHEWDNMRPVEQKRWLLAELSAARETICRLSQANADLRKERDRVVAEAQRQDGVAKGLRKELRQLFEQQHHTKLIGAAEWLEANNERLDTMNRSDVEEVAAQLRREAEDATR